MSSATDAPVLAYQVREPASPSSRPTLVWLHGNLSRLDLFDPLTDLLPDHRHVLIDYRGFGASAGITGDVSYERNADDVAAVLVHLGVHDAVVLGHSQGNAVGLRLAALHPELVRAGIALAGVPVQGMPPESKDLLDILPTAAGSFEAFREIVGPMFLKPGSGPMADALAASAVLVDRDVLAGYAGHLIADDSATLAPRVTQPWLVLAPEFDRVVPTDIQVSGGEMLPDGIVEVVPGEGHIYPQEAPEDATERIARFVEAL